MIDEKEVKYPPQHKNNSSEVNGCDGKINEIIKYLDDGSALNTYTFETLHDEFDGTNKEQIDYRGKENISIVITQKTNIQQKKQQKAKEEVTTQRCRKSGNGPYPVITGDYLKIMAKNCSTPDINKAYVNRKQKKRSSCSSTHIKKSAAIKTDFIVNKVTLEPHTIPPYCQDLLKHQLMQTQVRIYRCKLGSNEEKYCQACDSDAFFDVLKGLYDCYNNKNCANCNCILCSSFHKAKRKLLLGEVSRSKVSVAVETVATKLKAKETLKRTKDRKPTEHKETKITASSKEPLSLQLEKMRKAKASGILPTLEGYTSTQKEKTSNALVQSGSPLNGLQKAPDNKVFNQVRKELGLPEYEREAKIEELGHIDPFQKKNQNETILRAMAAKRIPSREVRPPLQLKEKQHETRVQSGKMRKARAAGLLAPNEALEQQEITHIAIEQHGIRLAEGKKISERNLIDKIKKDLCLTTPITKTALERIIKPILSRSHFFCPSPVTLDKKSKNCDQKPKVMTKGKGDLRISSLLKLQVNRKPESKTVLPCRITFETVKAAGTAGLFSQLQGKTKSQKEKVIRSLANQEIPFPEAKTPSEKKFAKKIRAQLGLPPAPTTKFTQTVQYEKVKAQSLIPHTELKANTLKKKNKGSTYAPEQNTPSTKEISRNVKSASVISPLKGEAPEQRALLFRKLKAASSKLAEERIFSERSPIQRMTISKSKGLVITPERKKPYDKAKMLRRLAKSGMRLPQGRTASDKELIKKIRTEMVLPLETITPSIKGKLSEARATCNRKITPFENKISTQAESIMKRVSETRIQRVQCSSSNDRSNAQKPIIKGVRSVKTGTGRVRKTKGVVTQSVAVVKDELGKKVNSKGTCEMGCGCDKKKIRFKHSYVRIRVTTPDTSSFCSCPHDCPGISGGGFASDEGIKVTVETATGLPSYKVQPTSPLKQTLLRCSVLEESQESSDDLIYSQSHISLEISSVHSDYTTEYSSSTSVVYIYNSESDVSISDIKRLLRESIDSGDFDESLQDCRQRDKPVSYIYQSRFAVSRAGIQRNRNQTAQVMYPVPDSCSGSFYSIETVSSSDVSDSNYIEDTLSYLSTLARNFGVSTDSFLLQRSVNEEYHDTEDSESLVKETDLVPVDTLLRNSRYLIDSSQESNEQHNYEEDVAIYRQSLQPFRSRSLKLQQLSGRRITQTKKDVISSTRLTGSSSFFFMVSTSGIDQYSSSHLETISKSLSSQNILSKARAWMDTKKIKLSRFDIFNRKLSNLKRFKQKCSVEGQGIKKSSACQKAAHKAGMKGESSAVNIKDQRPSRPLSMDTSREGLRYGVADEGSMDGLNQSKTNVISEILKPMIAREEVAQGFTKDPDLKMEYNQMPSSTCYPSDSFGTARGYVTPAECSGDSMRPARSSQRGNLYNQHFNNNVHSTDWNSPDQYSAEQDKLTSNSEVSLASTIYSSMGARSRGCVNPALYTAQRRLAKKGSDERKSKKAKKKKSCVCEDSFRPIVSCTSALKAPACASKKRCLHKSASGSLKKKHSRASVDSGDCKILNARDSVTKKKKHHKKKSNLKKKGRSLDNVKSKETQKCDSDDSADSRPLKKCQSEDRAPYRCASRSSTLNNSESCCAKRDSSRSSYAKKSSPNDSAEYGCPKKSHSHDSSRHRCRKKHSRYDGVESRYPKPFSYYDSSESRHRKRSSPIASRESRYTQKSSYGSDETPCSRKCSPIASIKSGHSRKSCSCQDKSRCGNKKYLSDQAKIRSTDKYYNRDARNTSSIDTLNSHYANSSDHDSLNFDYANKHSSYGSVTSANAKKSCCHDGAEVRKTRRYSDDKVKCSHGKRPKHNYAKKHSPCDSVEPSYEEKCFPHDGGEPTYKTQYSPNNSITSGDSKKCCSRHDEQSRFSKKQSARKEHSPHNVLPHKKYSSDGSIARGASQSSVRSSAGTCHPCDNPHRSLEFSNAKKYSHHNDWDSGNPQKYNHKDAARSRKGNKTYSPDNVELSYPKKWSNHNTVEPHYPEIFSHHDTLESRYPKKYSHHDNVKPPSKKKCSHHDIAEPSYPRTSSHQDTGKPCCQKKYSDQDIRKPCSQKRCSHHDIGKPCCKKQYSDENIEKSCSQRKCSHHDVDKPCCKKQYSDQDIKKPCSQIKCSHHDVDKPCCKKQYSDQDIKKPCSQIKCSHHDVDKPCCKKQYSDHDIKKPCSQRKCSHHDVEKPCCKKQNSDQDIEKPCSQKKCSHHDVDKPCCKKQYSHQDIEKPCSQRSCSHHDVEKPCCKKQNSDQDIEKPCCRNKCSHHDVEKPCCKKQNSDQDIKKPCSQRKCSHHDAGQPCCQQKCSHQDIGKLCCQKKCHHNDNVEPSNKKKNDRKADSKVSVDSCLSKKCINQHSFDSLPAKICCPRESVDSFLTRKSNPNVYAQSGDSNTYAVEPVIPKSSLKAKKPKERKKSVGSLVPCKCPKKSSKTSKSLKNVFQRLMASVAGTFSKEHVDVDQKQTPQSSCYNRSCRDSMSGRNSVTSYKDSMTCCSSGSIGKPPPCKRAVCPGKQSATPPRANKSLSPVKIETDKKNETDEKIEKTEKKVKTEKKEKTGKKEKKETVTEKNKSSDKSSDKTSDKTSDKSSKQDKPKKKEKEKKEKKPKEPKEPKEKKEKNEKKEGKTECQCPATTIAGIAKADKDLDNTNTCCSSKRQEPSRAGRRDILEKSCLTKEQNAMFEVLKRMSEFLKNTGSTGDCQCDPNAIFKDTFDDYSERKARTKAKDRELPDEYYESKKRRTHTEERDEVDGCRSPACIARRCNPHSTHTKHTRHSEDKKKPCGLRHADCKHYLKTRKARTDEVVTKVTDLTKKTSPCLCNSALFQKMLNKAMKDACLPPTCGRPHPQTPTSQETFDSVKESPKPVNESPKPINEPPKKVSESPTPVQDSPSPAPAAIQESSHPPLKVKTSPTFTPEELRNPVVEVKKSPDLVPQKLASKSSPGTPDVVPQQLPNKVASRSSVLQSHHLPLPVSKRSSYYLGRHNGNLDSVPIPVQAPEFTPADITQQSPNTAPAPGRITQQNLNVPAVLTAGQIPQQNQNVTTEPTAGQITQQTFNVLTEPTTVHAALETGPVNILQQLPNTPRITQRLTNTAKQTRVAHVYQNFPNNLSYGGMTNYAVFSRHPDRTQVPLDCAHGQQSQGNRYKCKQSEDASQTNIDSPSELSFRRNLNNVAACAKCEQPQQNHDNFTHTFSCSACDPVVAYNNSARIRPRTPNNLQSDNCSACGANVRSANPPCPESIHSWKNIQSHNTVQVNRYSGGPSQKSPNTLNAPKNISETCACNSNNKGRANNNANNICSCKYAQAEEKEVMGCESCLKEAIRKINNSPRSERKSCGSSSTGCKCERLEKNIFHSNNVHLENCLTENPRRCSPCDAKVKSTMTMTMPPPKLAQIAKNLPRTASGTVICIDQNLCEKLMNPCSCGVDGCNCHLPEYPLRRNPNNKCYMRNQQGQTCGARPQVGRCLQIERRTCPLNPLCSKKMAGPEGTCFKRPPEEPTVGPGGQLNAGRLNQMTRPSGQMLAPEGHDVIPHQPSANGELFRNRQQPTMGPRGTLDKGNLTQEPNYPTMNPQRPIENPNYQTMNPQRPIENPNYQTMNPQRPLDIPNYQLMGPQGQMQYPNYQIMGPQGQMKDPNYQTMGPQGQMEDPNYQTMDPQGQMKDPNYQTMGPQGQMEDPNYQTMGPQGQMEDPNYQTMGPQEQMEYPNYQIMGPQGQMEYPNYQMMGRQGQMKDPNYQTMGPQGQMVDPNYQTMGPQGQMEDPNYQTMGPQGQMEYPNYQIMGRQGQMKDPNYQTMGPQGQMVDPNYQTMGPQGQMEDPNYQTMDPQGQMKDPNYQTMGPQGQMVDPNYQTMGPQGQMEYPNLQTINYEMWEPQVQQEPNYVMDSQGQNPNMKQEMAGLGEKVTQNPELSMGDQMIGPNDTFLGLEGQNLSQQMVNRYYQVDPVFQGLVKMPRDPMLNPQEHDIRLRQQMVSTGQMTQNRSIPQKQLNNFLQRQMPYPQQHIIRGPSGQTIHSLQGPLRSGNLNRTNESFNLMAGAQEAQISPRQQVTRSQGQIVQNITQTENQARQRIESLKQSLPENTGLGTVQGDVNPPPEQELECTCQTQLSCFNQKVWKNVSEPCPCGPNPGPLVVVEKSEKKKCSDVILQIKSFLKTKLNKGEGRKSKSEKIQVGPDSKKKGTKSKEIKTKIKKKKSLKETIRKGAKKIQKGAKGIEKDSEETTDKEAGGPTVQIIYGPQGNMIGGYPDHMAEGYPNYIAGSYVDHVAAGYANQMEGGFPDQMELVYSDQMDQGYLEQMDQGYPEQMELGYPEQMELGYPEQMEFGYADQMEGGYPDQIVGGYPDHMTGPRGQMRGRYYNINPLDAIIYGPEGKMIGSSVGTMTQISQDQLRSRYNLLLDPQEHSGSLQWPSRKGSQGQVMYHTRRRIADYPSGQSSYYRWLGSQGQMDCQRSYSGGRIMPRGHISRGCHDDISRKSQGQSSKPRCSSYDRKTCSRQQLPLHPYDEEVARPSLRFNENSWNNVSASCSCRPTEDVPMPCQGTHYYQYLAGPMATGPETRYTKGQREHTLYDSRGVMETRQRQSDHYSKNQGISQEQLNRNNYQQEEGHRVSHSANNYDIRPTMSRRRTLVRKASKAIQEVLNANPKVPKTPSPPSAPVSETKKNDPTTSPPEVSPAQPIGPITPPIRSSQANPMDTKKTPPTASQAQPMGPRRSLLRRSQALPTGPRTPSPRGSRLVAMGPGTAPPRGSQAPPIGPRRLSQRGSQLQPMGAGTPSPNAPTKNPEGPKTQPKEGEPQTSDDSSDQNPEVSKDQTEKKRRESEALKTLLIKAAKQGGCSKEMCCSWHDLQKACLRELRSMKSDLARSTSGFQISQSKRPLVFCTSDSSYDSSDYSSEFNSECTSVKPKDKDEKSGFGNKFKKGWFKKKKGEENKGEEKKGEENKGEEKKGKEKDEKSKKIPQSSSESDKGRATDQVVVVEDDTFKGMKFYLEGKGGNSPGLSGIFCFNMTQMP